MDVDLVSSGDSGRVLMIRLLAALRAAANNHVRRLSDYDVTRACAITTAGVFVEFAFVRHDLVDRLVARKCMALIVAGLRQIHT